MTVHVYLIDDEGREQVALNGRTNRPASWPDAAAAQIEIDAWLASGTWNSGRDEWRYDFRIQEVNAAADNPDNISARVVQLAGNAWGAS